MLKTPDLTKAKKMELENKASSVKKELFRKASSSAKIHDIDLSDNHIQIHPAIKKRKKAKALSDKNC